MGISRVEKRVNQTSNPLLKSLTPEERKAVRLARVRAQRERLRPSVEKALGKPDSDTEVLTAEELQQLLLEEGVKPEDNIGSRAIIEERERRHR